jgi:hypothetical protein
MGRAAPKLSHLSAYAISTEVAVERDVERSRIRAERRHRPIPRWRDLTKFDLSAATSECESHGAGVGRSTKEKSLAKSVSLPSIERVSENERFVDGGAPRRVRVVDAPAAAAAHAQHVPVAKSSSSLPRLDRRLPGPAASSIRLRAPLMERAHPPSSLRGPTCSGVSCVEWDVEWEAMPPPVARLAAAYDHTASALTTRSARLLASLERSEGDGRRRVQFEENMVAFHRARIP